MTNQLDLANQVMGLFHEMPAVRHVFLRGSLSTGVFDEMSDVDIGSMCPVRITPSLRRPSSR